MVQGSPGHALKVLGGSLKTVKSSFRFGEFTLDTARRVLERDGRLVALPRKAVEILVVLLEERGRLVTKEELFRRVWPDVIVEENSLAQAVSALRKALRDGAGTHRFVETVARHGYRFVGEATIAPLAVEESPAISTPAPAAAVPVLAVLPFRFLAGAGDESYLELGLADALISRLAGHPDLRLRSTSAISRFTGADRDPLAAGRELAADYVVDGHLRQAGEHLAVSAQLLHVGDGDVLWAERSSERLEDLLGVEDRLAERIAQSLAAGWPAGRHPLRRVTRDGTAYRLYLKGRNAANRLSAASLATAREAFVQAIAHDPGFALAFEGLAYADLMALDLFVPSAEAIPRARTAATRALALDPSLALAHCALAGIALWHDRDLAAVEREIAAALRLDPQGVSTLRLVAWLLTLEGRSDKALPLLALAAEADPFDLEQRFYEISCFHFSRRFDDTLGAAASLLALDPGHWLAEVLTGRSLEALGRIDEACERFAAARALAPDVPEVVADLGRALALAGRPEEARALLSELAPGRAFPCTPAFNRALIHLGLRDFDACFAELEASLEERSWYVSWLPTAPVLDPLRDDPRFADLLRRSGLG
jgi:DNA-binding winged helix-turn-helix (wHTH) protein/tetratricopeptide (TPR) repeat protein